MDLDAIYDRIDSKNKSPCAQADVDRTDLYTRAVWTLGSWSTTDFLEDIRTLSNGIVFDIEGSRGKLHWTLLQFQTFATVPISPSQTTYDDAKLVSKIQAVLDRYPPLHITFRGIARTRFGLFLRGHPNYNINRLRDELRALCPTEMNEPHPQDICHSTLFRFTQEPTEQDIQLLDHLVEKYRNIELCTMRPSHWEFGYGTWAQRDADRRIVAKWPAKPAHWILHRGLSQGPDPSLENNEENLKKCIEDGWNVEFDLWYKDGQIWLGHDAPTTLLRDIGLLASKNTWIHCKNVAMLQYMVENYPFATFFSHDTDEAVLTSNGYIWCYPGFQAGKNSILVMPERVPTMQIDLTAIGGVCTDYLTLPQAFV
jgi:hypothetical protein